MSHFKLECCLFISVFFILSYNIFNFIFKTQPLPFIDEIFHVPQGLQYCNGNFSHWDPKITTLPGLYFLSYALLQPLDRLQIVPAPVCTLYNLRLINVLLSSGSLILLYLIISGSGLTNKKELHKKRLALWSAFNIAIFPVAFFFSFLYYTDTLATLSFLLVFKLHKSEHYWLAALFGVFSVLVRQTNIIWVGYMLLEIVFPKLRMFLGLVKLFLFQALNPNKEKARTPDQENQLKRNFLRHLSDSTGYLVVCLLFLLFVYFNGGIVVGDRTAHKPVFHLPQLFYLSLFILFFGFPHFIYKIKDFFIIVKKKIIIFLLLIICGCFVVYNFTMVHPYLLADNRHYSFYFWQRLYGKYVIIKYTLVPIYLFGFYCINAFLEKGLEFQFWLCCLLCLVPQKLLDFRYFIIPFILFRLQVKCEKLWILIVESIFYILINLLTIYIFVTKEFHWIDSKEVQRIIW